MKKSLNQIKSFMVKHRQTLAVAESVTAGNLQAAFSLADGATDFFQGGITTYNVGQKSLQLQIDPIYGLSCNCVSERIAVEMAQNVCKRFCCDWGISIVGYASPVPELKITTPFAYYAFARKCKPPYVRKIAVRKMSSEKVQKYYVDCLLQNFVAYLMNGIALK